MFDFSQIDLAKINAMETPTMVQHLGIQLTEGGEGYPTATMPVDERTCQPMGLLHGGASAVLAETLGSIGSFAATGKPCVGLEVSVNHLKAVKKGEVVKGKAKLLHFGKRTHFWEIEITNAKGELCAKGKLGVMVLDK